MKTTTTLTLASLIALASLATPAQAQMGLCLFGGPSQTSAGSGCTSEPQSNQACPIEREDQPSGCALGNPELGDMVGSMAAGGLKIAASVMRALAGEASRQLGGDPNQ